MTSINFQYWTDATARLDWGTQRVMRDTLALVAEEKVTLAYGTDYEGKHPCLVNAVAQMISVTSVNPLGWFPEVVRAFDACNRNLLAAGVNVHPHLVSPLAAEVLVANFGALKDAPVIDDYKEAAKVVADAVNVYREPTDAEFADYLAELDNPPTLVEGYDASDNRV